jgi:hypothetical protein
MFRSFCLILLPWFLVATHAYSQQRMSAFICDDITACTGNCVNQNRKFIFLLDKAKSIVKMNVYENEALARSTLFENCKVIFNNQNWDCSDKTEHATGALINAVQMNDGIYTASVTNYRTINGELKVTRHSAVCAK